MPTDPAAADLLALGEEDFVSLTTFRRSGEPVSTPVWISREGDALLVTTPAGSGKVKRLRHTARVELRPCSRSGKVADGVVPVPGRATVVAEAGVGPRLAEIFRAKYGFEYRVMMAIEKVAARGERERVMLRIVAPAAGAAPA